MYEAVCTPNTSQFILVHFNQHERECTCTPLSLFPQVDQFEYSIIMMINMQTAHPNKEHVRKKEKEKSHQM